MDHRDASHRSQTKGTALGFVAIVLWSTTVALASSMREQLGTLTAPASVYTISGLLACAHLLTDRSRLRAVLALPRRYLFGCGVLFTAYSACLYLALGNAADRAQYVDVGVVNYLWPALTVILSVPLLGMRARPTLVLGVAAAVAGVYLTAVREGSFSLGAFFGRVGGNPTPYLIMLIGSVCWALYSNLARRWGGGRNVGGVPLFLLATGLVLVAMRVLATEESHWSPRVFGEMAFNVLFATLLGYAFWDRAMRTGNAALVASVSCVTPLLATILVCFYYPDISFSWRLLIACLLVVAGAGLCKYSVVEPAQRRGGSS
jgi:drug/metabolite transporter (DMT)-like permease